VRYANDGAARHCAKINDGLQRVPGFGGIVRVPRHRHGRNNWVQNEQCNASGQFLRGVRQRLHIGCRIERARTIGIARAKTKIGLANLVYNIKRLLFLRRIAAS
jgi:hypothetical protein